MIKGEYEYLKKLASYNVCSEHQTSLEIAWYGQEKTWVLRCGHDHYPDSITKQLSLTQMYKAGEELPGHIEDGIKKAIRRRAMTKSQDHQDSLTALIPKTDLATGELLPIEMVTALIDYAGKYYLDPYRGHVVIMYGKPYIGIDGYLYHANRSGKKYSLVSRPMTTKEGKEYKIGNTDHGWIAEVIMLETEAKFTGLGIVTYEEMTAKSSRDATKLRSPVVAAHPWQLAQKRAEWQAMRRAFPIGDTENEKEEN